jgi:hypothetical protein
MIRSEFFLVEQLSLFVDVKLIDGGSEALPYCTFGVGE